MFSRDITSLPNPHSSPPNEASGRTDSEASVAVSVAQTTLTADTQALEPTNLTGKEIEVLSNPLVELPGDIHWEILRRIELSDLLNIGTVSKDCKTICSNPQIWKAVAAALHFELDDWSPKSYQEQVVDFLRDIKERVVSISDRPAFVNRLLDKTTIEGILELQTYLETRGEIIATWTLLRENPGGQHYILMGRIGNEIDSQTIEKKLRSFKNIDEMIAYANALSPRVGTHFSNLDFNHLRRLDLTGFRLRSIPNIALSVHTLRSFSI